MLRTLIRKELLANLRTMRLVIALVFTVVLCMLTTAIGSLDFSSNADEYRRVVAENRDETSAVAIYQDLTPTVFCRPQPLQVLSRGMLEGRGHGSWISVDSSYRGMARFGSGAWDDMLVVLVRADFTSVVALVLSFLAVVLGFDGICGERELGTLRLLLSNSVSRGQVVAAKLIGGMISLLVPLAVAFCGSMLILLANPDVLLTPDDWQRLLLLFALSGLLLSLIFSLSLMVSAITRTSPTSLIICLFLWLAGGVGYVNALPAIARYSIPYPPWEEFVADRQKANEAYQREMAEWDAKNPAPTAAYLVWLNRDGLIRYGHPQGYDWLARRWAYDFERRLERADQIYAYRNANQAPLAEQEFAVDRWSILSPITNYRTLSKLLLGSSLDDYFFACDYVFEHRRTYIQWVRARMQSFGWQRWFTDDPPGQEPMIVDPAAVDAEMLAEGSEFMRERMLWAEEQEKRLTLNPRKRLDAGDLPKSGPGWKRTLREALSEMAPGLLVLILSFVLSLLITVRRFVRYELN